MWPQKTPGYGPEVRELRVEGVAGLERLERDAQSELSRVIAAVRLLIIREFHLNLKF